MNLSHVHLRDGFDIEGSNTGRVVVSHPTNGRDGNLITYEQGIIRVQRCGSDRKPKGAAVFVPMSNVVYFRADEPPAVSAKAATK